MSDVNRGAAYAAAIVSIEPSASFRLSARRAFGLRAQGNGKQRPVIASRCSRSPKSSFVYSLTWLSRPGIR